MAEAWKYFWRRKTFRVQFIISLCVLASFTIIFPRFFDFIEAKTGPVLNDPVLNFLPAADMTLVIFPLLYLAIISWILTSLQSPAVLLTGIQTYCLAMILWIFSITFLSLDPPLQYVPLGDPFVQLFTSGGRIISKDLFYSGHMTTVLICFYNIPKGMQKKIYFILAMVIALLLLIQHAHYTIDVIAAPFFTWLCFLFVRKVLAIKN